MGQYCDFLQCLLKTVRSEKVTLRITFPHSVFSSSPVTKGVRRTVAVSPRGHVVFWTVLKSGCIRSFFYQNTLQDSAKLETVGQIVCLSFFRAVKDKGREETAGLDSKEI